MFTSQGMEHLHTWHQFPGMLRSLKTGAGETWVLPVVAMIRWFSRFMVIFADFHGVFMGISQELLGFYGN